MASFVVSIDFGTTKSGFAFCPATSTRNVAYVNPEWGESGQTDTSLLFDKDMNFVAFGADAIDEFNESKDCRDFLLFERFKMDMFDLQSKPKCRAIGHETAFDATPVFAAGIKFLAEEALRSINLTQATNCELEDAKFILTVPAIWNDRAKDTMVQAAKQAGLTNVELALEPEASSLAVRTLWSRHGEPLADKTVYALYDCGGGTVDVTIHRVDGSGLVQVQKPTGGDWGSTNVDKKFAKMLEDIFCREGEPNIDDFKMGEKQAWVELMGNFITQKEKMNKTKRIVSVALGFTFLEFFKCTKGGGDTRIEEYLSDHPDFVAKDIRVVRDKLMLSKSVMIYLFEECVANIQQHFEALDVANLNITHLFLTGGLAANFVLQDAMRAAADKRGVNFIVPPNPTKTVLEGAVFHGKQPHLISERIAPRTLAIATCCPWDPNLHPVDKQVTGEGGELMCMNVLAPLIRANESIRAGQSVERAFTPTSKESKLIKIKLYESPAADIRFTDEGNVKLMAVIRIPLQHPRNEEPTILVKISTGSTYIKVKCSTQGEHGVSTVYHEIKYDVEEEVAHEIIFLIDSSGSMGNRDIVPQRTPSFAQTRLGCVMEQTKDLILDSKMPNCLYSVLTFNGHARISEINRWPAPPLSSRVTIFDKLKDLSFSHGGNTSFVNAFGLAEDFLIDLDDPETSKTLVFLSDGEDQACFSRVQHLLQANPGLVIHCMQFGPDVSRSAFLQNVATIGNGNFSQDLTAKSLERAFFVIKEQIRLRNHLPDNDADEEALGATSGMSRHQPPSTSVRSSLAHTSAAEECKEDDLDRDLDWEFY